ncbi:MAG: c-type cytochrome [Candidatus Karelsulcia muelleri]
MNKYYKKIKLKLILISISIVYIFNIKNCYSNSNLNKKIEHGKNLFKQNCTACHSLELKKKLIGPPLYGINEKRNKKWLYKWIKNNKKLRESGDKEAIELFLNSNKVEMPLFTKFSKKEIKDILYFIKKSNNLNKKNNKIMIEKSNFNLINYLKDPFIRTIFLSLFILSLILIYLINKLIYFLKILKLNSFKENGLKKRELSTTKLVFLLIRIKLKIKKIYYIIQILFITYVIWILWIFLMRIDVNKGYKPNQPIFFSHKIHSGINQIPCEYCHSSSLYSKVSGIPSLNVCMNCHLSINEYNGNYFCFGKTKKYFDNEIKKIYKYLGWNERSRVISGKEFNIKWIRIHNLPDFVYFNHSQHIIVAGEEIKKSKKVDYTCEACHGDVKNMDKISMYNDFTMEWCIKCHKQTKINKHNKYYLNYFKNLNQTISSIGGIECGKCHY